VLDAWRAGRRGRRPSGVRSCGLHPVCVEAVGPGSLAAAAPVALAGGWAYSRPYAACRRRRVHARRQGDGDALACDHGLKSKGTGRVLRIAVRILLALAAIGFLAAGWDFSRFVARADRALTP